MADDADHFTGHVEQRTARVARIDRRVGLEQFRRAHPAEGTVGFAARADVPDREGVADPERCADHEDLVADLELGPRQSRRDALESSSIPATTGRGDGEGTLIPAPSSAP